MHVPHVIHGCLDAQLTLYDAQCTANGKAVCYARTLTQSVNCIMSRMMTMLVMLISITDKYTANFYARVDES